MLTVGMARKKQRVEMLIETEQAWFAKWCNVTNKYLKDAKMILMF